MKGRTDLVWSGNTSVADAQYAAAFIRMVARCDDFAQFDAEKVGRLASPEEWACMERLADMAARFVERGRKARALRVVGGKAESGSPHDH